MDSATARNSGDHSHTTGSAPVTTAAAPAGDPRPSRVPAPASSAAATATSPGSEAKPRSRARPFIILAIVAVLVLAAIVVYKLVTAGRESTDDAQVSADLVPIGTRVAGAIAHVRIGENQQVKRGELLVELDPADYQARVEQAEAELVTAQAQSAAAIAQVEIVEATSRGGFATARAALTGSAAGVGSADAQLAAAKAAHARAEAESHKADIDLARSKQLRDANAATQERLDAAQSAFDTARAGLAQADAQIALAEDARNAAQSRVGEARGRLSQSAPIAPQIASARAGADLASARVHSAQASLALARLQLGYTRVSAPIDGIASKLMVHEGQLVSSGQPLIALVPSATYVIANFKETQIGKMRLGQPADIEIDAFPGRTFSGKVQSLSGGTGASFSLLPADNATGNFVKVVQRVPVRVEWTNLPGDVPMRAGLSADVTVHVDK
jgi:membrane fusion protein (multidrug efflux system)